MHRAVAINVFQISKQSAILAVGLEKDFDSGMPDDFATFLQAQRIVDKQSLVFGFPLWVRSQQDVTHETFPAAIVTSVRPGIYAIVVTALSGRRRIADLVILAKYIVSGLLGSGRVSQPCHFSSPNV